MELFPAIDLIDGCAVRLVKGDYAQKTIYSENPAAVARSFAAAGAKYLHVVDLEGAKDGGTPNLETIRTIVRESGLLVEVGGGIRSEEVIKTYLDAGVFRVILGTAAVQNPAFLEEMVRLRQRHSVPAQGHPGRRRYQGWKGCHQGLDRGFRGKLLCLLRKAAENRRENDYLHGYFQGWSAFRHESGIISTAFRKMQGGYRCKRRCNYAG